MAKIPAVVAKLDEVPEPRREMYAQGEDGRFYLDVEGTPRGHVPAGQLAEFRENNRTLHTKATELEAELARTRETLKAFEGIDPQVARAALETHRKAEKKELLAPEAVQALVSEQVAAAVKPWAEKFETEAKEKAEAQRQLEERDTAQAIHRAAREIGELQPGAEDLLVGKARQAGWALVKGELQQVVNGTPRYSADNPGTPRQIKEWLLAEAVPSMGYLWKPSQGGTPPAGTRQNTGTPGVIDANDTKAFSENIADIASGKIKVRIPGRTT